MLRVSIEVITFGLKYTFYSFSKKNIYFLILFQKYILISLLVLKISIVLFLSQNSKNVLSFIHPSAFIKLRHKNKTGIIFQRQKQNHNDIVFVPKIYFLVLFLIIQSMYYVRHISKMICVCMDRNDFRDKIIQTQIISIHTHQQIMCVCIWFVLHFWLFFFFFLSSALVALFRRHSIKPMNNKFINKP